MRCREETDDDEAAHGRLVCDDTAHFIKAPCNDELLIAAAIDALRPAIKSELAQTGHCMCAIPKDSNVHLVGRLLPLLKEQAAVCQKGAAFPGWIADARRMKNLMLCGTGDTSERPNLVAGGQIDQLPAIDPDAKRSIWLINVSHSQRFSSTLL